MFGINNLGVNEYARVGIETGIAAATPHKLIVMLYEGAIRASQDGLLHLQNNEISKKGAALTKAIMIIESGLRLSLDKQAGGEIAISLDKLYEYMSNRLYAAHLKNDAAPIIEVIKLLTDIKTAWDAIANLEVANKPFSAAAKLVQTTAYANAAIAKA
jgi:flagellar protein FliS